MRNNVAILVCCALTLVGCNSKPEAKSVTNEPVSGLKKGPDFGKAPPVAKNEPAVASKAVGTWKVELAPATLKSFSMQKRKFLGAFFEFKKDGTFRSELFTTDEKDRKMILFQTGSYRGQGEMIYTKIDELGARTADGKNQGSRKPEGTVEIPYRFAKNGSQLEALDNSATMYKK